MGNVQQILAKYDLLRRQGLEARAALDVLRETIRALSDDDRVELAQRVRAHEKAAAQLSAARRAGLAESEAEGVACPHCGRKNRSGNRLCFACGQLLAKSGDSFQTQILDTADEEIADDAYFGPDSVLILTAHNTHINYEILPQHSDSGLVLGRSSGRGPMTPDIDLSNSEGNRLGVSRLHVSIRYDTQYNTLSVFDLGSANGTFVNGQRLHPHEVRILRHNDELRLGNMLLGVTFKHSARV